MKMINLTKSIICESLADCSVILEYLDFYRADYADDDNIRELLMWKHPHIDHSETFKYTDEENAVMLRLPRKECQKSDLQRHLTIDHVL